MRVSRYLTFLTAFIPSIIAFGLTNLRPLESISVGSLPKSSVSKRLRRGGLLSGLADPAILPAESLLNGDAQPVSMQLPKEANRYTSTVQIYSKLCPEDFVPDGNLEKKAWRGSHWTRFDRDAFTTKLYLQSETEVAACWTATYVYFAFRCKYTVLNIYPGEDPKKERWELWNRDVVEVFANPEPARVNHYYEFEVAPNNQWIDLEIDLDKSPFNDAGWNSGFQHATRIDASHHVWTLEMRIPALTMNASPIKANTEWRINFYRADGPGNDTQRRFLSWSQVRSEKQTFHVPTSFGLIRFVRDSGRARRSLKGSPGR